MTEETVLAPEPRKASSPFAGAVRQVLRAGISAGAAYLLTKGIPIPPDTIEAVVVGTFGVLMTGLAALGKMARDREWLIGKIL